MPDPMRIRAVMAGDAVDVRVMIAHRMEPGLHRDASGNAVPAHFIQHVSVAHGGRTVLSAQWGPAISRNPLLHFRFRGGRPGERIAITWTDNRGGTRSDEAAIAAS